MTADTWANDVQGAGPTLDDLFDLTATEVGEYRDWCEAEGLDPWQPSTYRTWRSDRV